MKATSITVYLWLAISVLSIITTFIALSHIRTLSGGETFGMIVGDAYALLNFFVLLKLKKAPYWNYDFRQSINDVSMILTVLWVITTVIGGMINIGLLVSLGNPDNKDPITSVQVLCMLFADTIIGLTTYTFVSLRKELY